MAVKQVHFHRLRSQTGRICYAKQSGSTIVACSNGTYQPNFEQATCLICPLSSSTDGLNGSNASTACKCNAGYSGPDGGTCLICSTDNYKDSTVSAAFTPCPSASTTDTSEHGLIKLIDFEGIFCVERL